MPSNKGNTYYDVLTAAINDIAENGYDSIERISFWQKRLKEAAERTMASTAQMEQMLRDALAAIYHRMVEQGKVAQYHQGVARFTIEKIRPQLRAELDRRIVASADLIKLNRQAAMEKTLQRFSGWATSIPAGGSDAAKKGEAKKGIRKAMQSLPFEERRVLIDQSHKLTASISEILAKDGNALAGVWHSHWRQAGYNYREDHKERDQQVYLLEGSWALEQGLIKVGPAGWYKNITSVGEEPFCRCYMTWIYNLHDVPSNMITVKGKAALEDVRKKIREMTS